MSYLCIVKTKQQKKMKNIIKQLGQVEKYDPKTQNCWPFKRSIDIVNGVALKLSNMCGGFGFEFNGRIWNNSEVLYLCGEFSNGSEQEMQIQNELINTTSGYAAKRFIKAKYIDKVRPDFTSFRLQWMLFVVWQKTIGNARFRELLMSIPTDAILIEDTTTDNGGTANIWGCANEYLMFIRKEYERKLTQEHADRMTKKALKEYLAVEINKIQKYGEWVGENNIGKILMICRDCLYAGTQPNIDYKLLDSKNIHILGERVDFKSFLK